MGDFVLRVPQVEMEGGKTYLLIGESGAGKSLFLQVLGGICRPTDVVFTRDGHIRTSEQYMQLARGFGFIQKDEHLFDRTVLDNVLYGASAASKTRAAELLRRLNMQDRAGRSAKELSAGEVHRTVFVRELLRSPELFIIDEGLDSVEAPTKKLMLQLLREACPDCICVVCTHNWNRLMPVDGILRVHDGQLSQGKYCDQMIDTQS